MSTRKWEDEPGDGSRGGMLRSGRASVLLGQHTVGSEKAGAPPPGRCFSSAGTGLPQMSAPWGQVDVGPRKSQADLAVRLGPERGVLSPRDPHLQH